MSHPDDRRAGGPPVAREGEGPAAPSEATQYDRPRVSPRKRRRRRSEGESYPAGTVIDRYVVLDHLGSGAMGSVYKAYDPDLARPVALKLLSTRTRSSKRAEMYRARLLREAQALARLNHPNVVTVHDVGVLGEEIFLAMELVEGVSLRRWLREGQERGAVLAALIAAGEGLAAAHRAGLVHRDFKPDNVFIDGEGRVRVLDFGLVRHAEEQDSWQPGIAEPGSGPDSAEVAGDVSTADDAPDTILLAAGDPGAADGMSDVIADLGQEETPLAASARDVSGVRSSQPVGAVLTEHGALLGTPGYMAPEQITGHAVDARADQFAFCVTLYEAMLGDRPFRGATVHDVLEAICAGRVMPPRKPPRVPGWLLRIAERGLARDPDARFPSMDALLDELRRDRDLRLRRGLVGGALLLTGGLVAAVALRAVGPPAEEPCGRAGQDIATVWSPAQIDAVRAAFDGSGVPYAARAFANVDAAIDEYVGQWQAVAREACEATRVTGTQSEQLLDLRVACLDRRRSELARLVAALQDADADVVRRADYAVSMLAPIAWCSDTEALVQRIPPPRDASAAAAVEALRTRLADIEVAYHLGRGKLLTREAAAVEREARVLDYAPLHADALRWLGAVQSIAGDYEAAVATLERAVWTAVAAHEDAVAAVAAAKLLWLTGYELRQAERADTWARATESLLDRSRAPDSERAEYWHSWAQVASTRGLLDEAVAAQQRALAAWRARPAAFAGRIAAGVNNLGVFHGDHGKWKEARRYYEESLALRERSFGRQHPGYAGSLVNLGTALINLDEPARALELYDEAEAIWRSLVPEDDIELAFLWTGKASALHALERYGEALVPLERSIAIFERHYGAESIWVARPRALLGFCRLEMGDAAAALGDLEASLAMAPDDPQADRVRFGIARGLWMVGRQQVRALGLARRARDGVDDETRAQIDAWLAERQ